jgi:hypothetical protein
MVVASGFEPPLTFNLAFKQLIDEAAAVILRRFMKAHLFRYFPGVCQASPTLTE